jgi:hypothetical protein
MKKIDVRCWEYDLGSKGIIYVTYPGAEAFGGYELYTCTECGEIYGADTISQEYIMPLSKQMKSIECIGCGKKLLDTYRPYPEKFLNLSGQIDSFEKPREILPDDQSIIKSFYSIY